jgi:hypothetical protein
VWCGVVRWSDTNVSDDRAASIKVQQHGPPKRWYPTTTLHGVTTQKTANSNFTAVKTSNFVCNDYILYKKKKERTLNSETV